MNDLVRGGQGRSGEDVEAAAFFVGLGWAVGITMLLVAIVVGLIL